MLPEGRVGLVVLRFRAVAQAVRQGRFQAVEVGTHNVYVSIGDEAC